MNHHWIALYLSGQYPGKYIVPNKLDIVFKIRQYDSSNFGDTIVSLLHGKSDVEYFKSLLQSFQDFHGENRLNELLERINVPDEVRNDPFDIHEQEELKIKKKNVKTIGFIAPFDRKHEKLQDLMQKYLDKDFKGWDIKTASLEKDGDGKYLWSSIDDFLEKYPLYIVDFRDGNLNVAMELGGILKTGKPCITIVEDKLPTDIAGFIYVKKPKVSMEDEGTKEAQKEFLDNFSAQLRRYII